MSVVTRKVKDDERTFCRTKGVYLKEHAVAHDMIVVIVNKNSPVSKLSKDQIAALRADHGVYMAGSGRINVAGLTMANIDQFVRGLAEVSG